MPGDGEGSVRDEEEATGGEDRTGDAEDQEDMVVEEVVGDPVQNQPQTATTGAADLESPDQVMRERGPEDGQSQEDVDADMEVERTMAEKQQDTTSQESVVFLEHVSGPRRSARLRNRLTSTPALSERGRGSAGRGERGGGGGSGEFEGGGNIGRGRGEGRGKSRESDRGRGRGRGAGRGRVKLKGGFARGQ
jgi:hypothetical protein